MGDDAKQATRGAIGVDIERGTRDRASPGGHVVPSGDLVVDDGDLVVGRSGHADRRHATRGLRSAIEVDSSSDVDAIDATRHDRCAKRELFVPSVVPVCARVRDTVACLRRRGAKEDHSVAVDLDSVALERDSAAIARDSVATVIDHVATRDASVAIHADSTATVVDPVASVRDLTATVVDSAAAARARVAMAFLDPTELRYGVAPREAPMKTFATKDEMDPQMVQTVSQMMESQAYRELAAAQMFGFGLQYVPELKWLKFMTWHIREEMEHYEVVYRMYKDFTGDSVEAKVNARLAQKPIAFAKSWFELAMAQFLYDRGGFWQLKEYDACAFLPYREIITKILKEEAGHQGLGERIVVELCRSGAHDGVKQDHFETWLKQGLLSFGRPGTDGNRYAIEAGLKKRDSGAVMQDFLDDIKPAVKACGLTFPDPKKLGLDTPATLDWSLEHVDASKAEGYAAAP
jgi:1,2-phenylacetyl-CoA epoxidase catalytic subunit